MRTFVSIELTDAAREHLQRVQATVVATGVDGLRLAAADSLHLTLKFLGEVTESNLATLIETLGTIRRREPVLLQTQELKLLPPSGPIRIVAADMGGDAAGLRGLQRAVEMQSSKAGFVPDARGFRPHVTLARCQDSLPEMLRPTLVRPTLPLWPGPSFLADQFHLTRSEPGPSGAVFTRLQSFAFLATPIG